MDHADAIHRGQFTSKTELAAASRADLEMLGVPKGAAGAIVKAAGSTGDLLVALNFLSSALSCMQRVCFYTLRWS